MERYDSDVFGPEYRDNLFLCQFNLRKVSRHILKPSGSTYSSTDSDFVWSDFVDFHPTDVQVDADGSLLVIDTGGWYKLCCPTSQLWKPDVVGGIYRVRKIGAKPPADPRGKQIDWKKQTVAQLWSLLGDDRFAVRQRASRELVSRSKSPELQRFVSDLQKTLAPYSAEADRSPQQSAPTQIGDSVAAIARVWLLSQIDLPPSRKLIRDYYLVRGGKSVRHTAMQSISLNHDAAAYRQLIDRLASDTAANRRIAAEALGRIGNRDAVKPLLSAAREANDRISQHSVIFALIELADPLDTRVGLIASPPRTMAAALIALDQMPGGDLKPNDVIPRLGASDATLRDAARWIARAASRVGQRAGPVVP